MSAISFLVLLLFSGSALADTWVAYTPGDFGKTSVKEVNVYKLSKAMLAAETSRKLKHVSSQDGTVLKTRYKKPPVEETISEIYLVFEGDDPLPQGDLDILSTIVGSHNPTPEVSEDEVLKNKVKGYANKIKTGEASFEELQEALHWVLKHNGI